MFLARFQRAGPGAGLARFSETRQRRFGVSSARAPAPVRSPTPLPTSVLIAPSAPSPAAVSSANGDHRRTLAVPLRHNWSRNRSRQISCSTPAGVCLGRPQAGAPGRQSGYRSSWLRLLSSQDRAAARRLRPTAPQSMHHSAMVRRSPGAWRWSRAGAAPLPRPQAPSLLHGLGFGATFAWCPLRRKARHGGRGGAGPGPLEAASTAALLTDQQAETAGLAVWPHRL